MTDKKIIAVLGATGLQGGSLAAAIFDDPDGPFAVRALTRDPDSPKAKDLAARGAEVVRADLDDEASLEAAFDGAYGAYVVTNFFEPRTSEQDAERSRGQMEIDQARNAAKAAKAAGLRHVVWSTLEDTRPHFAHFGSEPPNLEDGYKVPHFDAKAEANSHFTTLGVPTTFYETAYIYETFVKGQGPRRNASGQLELTLPMGDSVMALVAGRDIGRTAYGIFKAGSRYVGRTVNLAGTHADGNQLAETFTKVLGEPVIYRPATHDEFRGLGFPYAEEFGNMFQFFTEAADSYVGERDLDLVRTLNPDVQSLEEWIRENREELKSWF